MRAYALALLLCLCAVLCPRGELCAASATDMYYTARNELDTLFKTPGQAKYRAAWLRLADTFDALYRNNPGWQFRPAARHRSARAYDGLARHSFLAADAAEAVRRYTLVANHFPRSPLADDSLYAAAQLQLDCLKDTAAARALLIRQLKQFPAGDMAKDARALLQTLQAPPQPAPVQTDADQQASRLAERLTGGKNADASPAPAKTARATLTALTCKAGQRSIRLTLEMDRPVNWSVFSQRAEPRNGKPPCLTVELPDTRLARQIPAKQVFRGMLADLRVVTTSSNTTRVVLYFNKLTRFLVRAGNAPEILIIDATTRSDALYDGKNPGENVHAGLRPAPVVTPADITAQLGLTVRTVVIDAGHGGNDPGALGNGLVEKKVVLDLSRRVARQLKQKGFVVRTVRDRDVRVALEDRVKFANEVRGDLFLSIHVNANRNTGVSGLEIYYLNFASSDSASRVAAVENSVGGRSLGELEEMLADIMLGARTMESKRLAYSVQTSTLALMKKKRFSLRDGGVRSAPLHVLMGSGMPGVLVEVGYCTNKTEARNLTRKEYLDSMAEGIAEGVKLYATHLGRP